MLVLFPTLLLLLELLELSELLIFWFITAVCRIFIWLLMIVELEFKIFTPDDMFIIPVDKDDGLFGFEDIIFVQF